jgi:hypothetical protein
MTKIMLLKFLVVWIVLHVILFFVEWYRYKHGCWSWYGFKTEGMLDITYLVIVVDEICGTIAIVGSLVYWILN